MQLWCLLPAFVAAAFMEEFKTESLSIRTHGLDPRECPVRPMANEAGFSVGIKGGASAVFYYESEVAKAKDSNGHVYWYGENGQWGANSAKPNKVVVLKNNNNLSCFVKHKEEADAIKACEACGVPCVMVEWHYDHKVNQLMLQSNYTNALKPKDTNVRKPNDTNVRKPNDSHDIKSRKSSGPMIEDVTEEKN